LSKSKTGQVAGDAARVYEAFFVPSLFGQWGDGMMEAAGVAPGHRVLDVGCGTGVLARAAAERTDPGLVTGIDINDGMLAVAREAAPDVTWQTGRAEDLPFAADAYDAVVSQFGLMFFQDREKAIAEMLRVLRPGGRLAVAVWDSLENTPGYEKAAALLHRLFGAEAADSLRVPYCLGDAEALTTLFTDAGVPGAVVTRHDGTARFDSIASWMHTDVKGWTLADVLDDAQFAELLAAAETELAEFVTEEGTVAFPAPALVVTAEKT
jgi:SAM-dependent methyltransferase